MTVEEENPTKGDILRIQMNGEIFLLRIIQVTRNKVYTEVDSSIFYNN